VRRTAPPAVTFAVGCEHSIGCERSIEGHQQLEDLAAYDP
jgi:hypothetical protein